MKELDDIEAHDLVKGDGKERKTNEAKTVERGRVEVSSCRSKEGERER